MKAILLAAGLGTRLRPITDSIPKCLVPVGGRPLLDIWLQQLTAAGFTEILINSHYLHEKVEAHITSSRYSAHVTTSYEPSLLGSLGTVRHNLSFIDGQECLIAHADNYCVAPWGEFLSAYQHRPENCDMTMMLFNTDNYRSCGMVEVDSHGVLSRYVEKPQQHWPGTLANGAIFWFSYPAIQKMCQLPEQQNDICRDFLPLRVNKANTWLNTHTLLDIGTPRSLKKAQEIFMHEQKKYVQTHKAVG